MSKVAPSIRQLFESGKYLKVLEVIGSSASTDPAALTYLVGAHAFLGDVYQADARFNQLSGSADLTDRIKAGFFLAVMHTRHHAAAKALGLVVASLRNAKHVSSRTAKGYAYLGGAFYRYTYGRLSSSQKFAELALEAGVQTDDIYIQFLAQDLLAHCQFGLGGVERGFALLNQAESLAEQLGQGAVLQASSSTKILYRSTFGLLSKPIADLQRHRKSLKYRDSYMIAQFELETARHEILSGQVTQACHRLLEVKNEVFSRGNLRLMTLHQLRLAHCISLQGYHDDSISILNDAIGRLGSNDGHSDIRLRLGLLGLMQRLNPEQEVRHQVIRLTRKSGNALSARIAKRTIEGFVPQKTLMWGVDPLGDLIDRACRSPFHAYDEITARDLLGLLRILFEGKAGQTQIVLGLPRDEVLISHAGDIKLVTGLSAMQQRLINVLAEKPLTNEELWGRVWGGQYAPARHDHVISSFISRLRGIPAVREMDILQKKQGCWDLAAFVKQVGCLPAIHGESQLNYRQRTILSSVANDPTGAVTVSALQTSLGLPRRTIQRDCQILVAEGLFKKQGTGNSIRYQIESH